MANALFDKGREGFLNADIDWLVDDIRGVLVDVQDYTVDLALHQFLSSVPVAGRVSTSGPLTSKTSTAGVADAADVTLTAVTGDVSEALVIFKFTGVDATANLIAYIDTATGLPVTPNTGNIVIQWDNGANRIFKL